MASPVKDITYVSGVVDQAPPPMLQSRKISPIGREALAAQVAPKMWKPIYALGVQLQASFQRPARPFVLTALISLVLTLFWREGSKRPRRGQLWPRTR